MTTRKYLAFLCLLALIVVVTPVTAQTPAATQEGFSAVWSSDSTPVPIGSESYVDGAPWAAANNGDICKTISSIISSGAFAVMAGSNLTNGVVIDLRAFPYPPPANGNATPIPCNYNPFSTVPAAAVTFLLPTGFIATSATLTLPQYVRLIGGAAAGSSSTWITPGTNFPLNNGSYVIQMGSPSTCGNGNNGFYDCQGIVLEHLGIYGLSPFSNVNGILNNAAEELSYLNDIFFWELGTGLNVTSVSASNANNSGPYTNILCVRTSLCINIQGTHSTRGFSGITAYSSIQGINLNAPNNTISDFAMANVQGYEQPLSSIGIIIGDLGNAQNNIIKNVNAQQGALAPGGSVPVTPVIIISSATMAAGAAGASQCPAVPGGAVPNVCDLTIMGVTGSDIANNAGIVILDGIMNTTLTEPADTTVGTYILGENVATGVSTPTYSRFTTSQSAPSWSFGSGTPSGTCAVGSLYSCTTTSCQSTSGSPATLFACVNTGAQIGWSAVK